jgi:hypothetical protein
MVEGTAWSRIGYATHQPRRELYSSSSCSSRSTSHSTPNPYHHNPAPYRQRELIPNQETITKWKVGLTSSIPSQLSRFFHQPAGRQPAPAITDAHGHLEWPFGLLCRWEEGDDFFQEVGVVPAVGNDMKRIQRVSST